MVLQIPLTRFTTPARRALVLAEEQAIAGHREAIGTGDVLLGLLHGDGGVAARALGSLGITAEAVREGLTEINHPEEDGPSSRGISQHITFTRVFMGMLSQALSKEVIRTGHAEEGQKRTPEGNPYLCTGEILLPMVRVSPTTDVGLAAPAALQVLARLGVDLRVAQETVLEFARRSPANEDAPRSDEFRLGATSIW